MSQAECLKGQYWEGIVSKISKFADDTKLSAKVYDDEDAKHSKDI